MTIKIVFHEHFYNSNYAMDPAASEGRLEGIMTAIKRKPELYEIITPDPACEADILRVYGRNHYESIKNDPLLYELAALAAGGAIKAAEKDVDIFAVSAGFDQGIDDWGALLYPEDYTNLRRLMKEYSEKLCNGRRYAILEGGYNHDALGLNTDSFCEGFN